MKLYNGLFIAIIFLVNTCLFGNFHDISHEEMVALDIAYFDLNQNRNEFLNDLKIPITIEQELELLKKEPYINISLGKNCYIASGLKAFGLRVRSFPFDWNVTSLNGLHNLIEKKFKGFLDLKNICVKYGGPGLYNKYYDCWIAHDFHEKHWKNNFQGHAITDCLEEINHYHKICAYYERRIARFYGVFTLGVPLYLFRREISSHEAQELYAFLKKNFKNAPFTLVCIEDKPKQYEPVKNWKKNPHIKHFRLSSGDVKNSKNEWRNMFIKLGMIT